MFNTEPDIYNKYCEVFLREEFEIRREQRQIFVKRQFKNNATHFMIILFPRYCQGRYQYSRWVVNKLHIVILKWWMVYSKAQFTKSGQVVPSENGQIVKIGINSYRISWHPAWQRYIVLIRNCGQ